MPSSSKFFLIMFSFNPLPYLLAAVASAPLSPNLPVQSFETALAPLLDIATCDGMVDRIRGFEPFSAGGQMFLAIQAAPGHSEAMSSEFEAPVIGPLDALPSGDEAQSFIGRRVCVAVFS